MPHYHITIQPTKTETSAVTRIIEAKNQSRAIAHVVGDTIVARLAEPADFMAHARAGNEIETATEE
jgi:hypothetical protein